MGKTRLKAQIVQPEDIAYIWEEVAPLLNRVKEHSEGEAEPDDFLEPPDLGIIHATIERSVHFLEALPCEDELAVNPVAF